MNLPRPPWIAGHRGAAGEALENTLPSFHLALEQGADLVELDLQLTADGRLAVFHDWDLRRLARSPRVVEETSLAALQAQELAPGARLPSLEDVLAALPPAFPLNIELKRRAADRRLFAARVAAATAVREEILFSSFDWDLLAELGRLACGRPLAPIGERDPEGLLAAARALGAWSLHCHERLASAALVAVARQDGRPVLAYTVNDGARARALFELGVAGLFTDHPGRLRAALRGPT